MGMDVIGWNRTRHADVTVPMVELNDLLATRRRRVHDLTLGDETRGFLNADRIAA